MHWVGLLWICDIKAEESSIASYIIDQSCIALDIVKFYFQEGACVPH